MKTLKKLKKGDIITLKDHKGNIGKLEFVQIDELNWENPTYMFIHIEKSMEIFFSKEYLKSILLQSLN